MEQRIHVARAVQHADKFYSTFSRQIEKNIALERKTPYAKAEFIPHAAKIGLLSQKTHFCIKPVNKSVRLHQAVLRDEIPYFVNVNTGAGEDSDSRHSGTTFNLGPAP